MNNYFDKQGNYINCENLSLAEIYHRAFALGVESVAIGNRPQGEWIKKVDDAGFVSYICSECGAEIEVEDTKDDKFCFNCGAKMKEGTENETDKCR